jgi:hypothetical protein
MEWWYFFKPRGLTQLRFFFEPRKSKSNSITNYQTPTYYYTLTILSLYREVYAQSIDKGGTTSYLVIPVYILH